MGPKPEGPLAAPEGPSGGEGMSAPFLYGLALQAPKTGGLTTAGKLPIPQLGVPVPVRVGTESLGEQKPGLCSGVTFATLANVSCLGPLPPPTC